MSAPAPGRRAAPPAARFRAAAILLGATFAACGRATSGPAAERALRADLVTANRILSDQRVVDGYGHVSARSAGNSQRFLLSRAIAPGLVTASDLIEYELSGQPARKTKEAGYAERFIHAAIYRARPDVRAVVHCHAPSVIPFADSTVPLRPMYHMSAFLTPGVPIFEIRDVSEAHDMLVTDGRLGEALARTLGDKAVVLMRGHGAVVVGHSLSEAVSRSVYLDRNARMQVAAATLGGPVAYVEADDQWGGPELFDEAHPYDRNWELWKAQAAAAR